MEQWAIFECRLQRPLSPTLPAEVLCEQAKALLPDYEGHRFQLFLQVLSSQAPKVEPPS